MKLVKQTNGNVFVTDDSGNFLKAILTQEAQIEPSENDNDTVHVVLQNERWENFKASEVTATQVLPAAEVPFTGDKYDLAELLATDFFFDEVGGGENPADEIIKYTAQTIGAVTVDVADFAPEDGQMVSLEVIFQGRTTDGFQWFGKRYRSATKEGANVFFTTQNSSVTINTIGTATDGNINVVGSLGLRLQVTGVAGKTTDWKITVKKYTINN